ncbi:MAG: hypothetical protein KAX46_09770, partial [Chromatiaceae bacterium]|nr:hypothetical protein [Chromatiaceae bacterium]
MSRSHGPPTPGSPFLGLICPAGSLPALKVAVDHGAEGGYPGLKNSTNPSNFAGLIFDDQEQPGCG